MGSRTEVEEFLEALAQRRGKDDVGATLREIAIAMGRSYDVTRKLLRPLALQGKIICGKRKVKSIDGRDVTTPVYKIKA